MQTNKTLSSIRHFHYRIGERTGWRTLRSRKLQTHLWNVYNTDKCHCRFSRLCIFIAGMCGMWVYVGGVEQASQKMCAPVLFGFANMNTLWRRSRLRLRLKLLHSSLTVRKALYTSTAAHNIWICQMELWPGTSWIGCLSPSGAQRNWNEWWWNTILLRIICHDVVFGQFWLWMAFRMQKITWYFHSLIYLQIHRTNINITTQTSDTTYWVFVES